MGQFLTVDPLVDVTDRAYAYTGDDPVNGVDPSGLYAYQDDWAIGGYSSTDTPQSIMAYFQNHLQSVFPFSTGDCKSIVLDESCNLEIGGKINQVEVVN